MKGYGRSSMDVGAKSRGCDQLLPNYSSSSKSRELFPSYPSCQYYPAPTRFSRERGDPKAQPLPNTSSTWSLVVAEVRADGNTGSRLGPPKRDKVGGDEPGSQGPPAGGVQVGGPKAQDRPDPPMQDRTLGPGENPTPQTEDKPSLFKRAVEKVKKFMKSGSVLAL